MNAAAVDYRAGEAALAQGELQQAETLLRHCIELDPMHAAAHHLLGKLASQQGCDQEALQWQMQSCALAPWLGWNWFAAAELKQKEGDWQIAAELFDKAAEQLPQECWIRELAAQAQCRQLLDGENLAAGLGPKAYQYWVEHLETRLPGPATLLREPWLLLDLERLDQAEASQVWPVQGWVVLVGVGASLRQGALLALEQWLAAQHPRMFPDLIYSDEDRLGASGERCDPWFKTGWLEENFWAYPWLDNLSVWRSSWLREHQLAWPPASQGERLGWILQALEAQPRIGHVPQVLVHGPPAKPRRMAEALQLQAHLQRCQENVKRVSPHAKLPGAFQLQWALPGRLNCRVVIPTRDKADLLSNCLESVWRSCEKSGIKLQFVVVDNGSKEAATQKLLNQWQQRLPNNFQVLFDSRSFNWSLLNNAAVQAGDEDLLLFLNNDVEALQPGWLDALAAQALRPRVGAVGALLLYPDHTIQHAGVVVGMHGGADHAYRGLPLEHGVHRSRSECLSRWGAVTGACLMLRRQLFERLGGFDPGLPVEFNDVDFCLRLNELGYHNLVVPEAVLYHHESQSRDSAASKTAASALKLMQGRWRQRLAGGAPWWPEACCRDHSDGRPGGFEAMP